MSDAVTPLGTCWHCGGVVAEDDEQVQVGSLVYHRGCARRLADDLWEALDA